MPKGNFSASSYQNTFQYYKLNRSIKTALLIKRLKTFLKISKSGGIAKKQFFIAQKRKNEKKNCHAEVLQ